jgi:hypothetical protein
MEKIGPQHGIEAARQREKQLHPAYAAAWDKRSNTFLQLVENQNELIDQVADLRRAVNLRPFS